MRGMAQQVRHALSLPCRRPMLPGVFTSYRSPSVHTFDAPYSPAIRYRDLLAISGQVAVDADGVLVGEGDIEAQARQAFRNIGGLLDAAGLTFRNVFFLRYYLVDMEDWPAVGRVRSEFLEPPVSGRCQPGSGPALPARVAHRDRSAGGFRGRRIDGMTADPVLAPRIETVPPVSPHALELFRDNLVWDNTLPWTSASNSPDIDRFLPRWHAVGVNYASVTMDVRAPIERVLAQIETTRRQVADRSEWLVLAASVPEIRAARAAGKLALGLNMQDTVAYGTAVDAVQRLYDLGVRQAGLAYNNRNFVGDGCAEPDNAGLSLLGRAMVAEMHRVGVLVDGSHAGHRTTMEAMEIGGAPFIFSHSNPFGVRPHYRNVRDDQLRACAATGGIVGINGVGYWCGDNDASTEAIFRCLDYTVELIGAEQVGLGFDYVYDLDQIIHWVRDAPLLWPAFEGEWMVKHNYAGPEQMVDLVQAMLDHGYPDEAIVGILGANWERLAAAAWR